jgi:multiple antibiotic resistance protein
VPTTLVALVANLVVCWALLANVARIERIIGGTGARALSKIVSLLLAGIGVHLIRHGLAR